MDSQLAVGLPLFPGKPCCDRVVIRVAVKRARLNNVTPEFKEHHVYAKTERRRLRLYPALRGLVNLTSSTSPL
ncbi:hypothetical protein Q8A67_016614 [Cirrhinus molitorella]|uniref:Uncharacterized protein n=1 Tax=Cirrhinus molitorella TaxID=172907 RepID=A0AA88PID5_9TELE|nr:hypothetical protein Q8A67_016614 [Cirrhinus molitorella]